MNFMGIAAMLFACISPTSQTSELTIVDPLATPDSIVEVIPCPLDSFLTANLFSRINPDSIIPYYPSNNSLTPLPKQLVEALGLSPVDTTGFPYPAYRYYSLHKHPDFQVFTYLIDEGEFVSIQLVVVKDCKVTSQLGVASASAWEHGYKRIVSTLSPDGKLALIRYSGGRDFGDYQTWKRDTVKEQYWISPNGKFVKQ